jgi:DNA-binding transcriptional ArsR family regulator
MIAAETYFHLALFLIFTGGHLSSRVTLPLRPQLLKTLGSEARLRILLVLARNRGEDLTIYKIAKFSGLDRKVIRKHLGKLIATDLVHMKSYGPIFVYSINSDNAPVQRIIDLFNEARLLAQVPVQLHWYDIRA